MSEHRRSSRRAASPTHPVREPPTTRPLRRKRAIATEADRAALREAYRFVAPTVADEASSATTWRERMALRYHARLYKTYAIADLSRPHRGVGLRWRTRNEVRDGVGERTCGNRACPAFRTRVTEIAGPSSSRTEQEERDYLNGIPHGAGLFDYEVPFAYEEDGERKNELVKVSLCLRCAPSLFHDRGGSMGAKRAREGDTEDDDRSIEDNATKHQRRKRKRRKRRKRSRRSRSISDDDTNSDCDSDSSSSSSDGSDSLRSSEKEKKRRRRTRSSDGKRRSEGDRQRRREKRLLDRCKVKKRTNVDASPSPVSRRTRTGSSEA